MPAPPRGSTAVASQIVSVEASVNAALTAIGCGHDVPNGKVIDVDVTTQSAVFFDDTCVAGESLVTTGRPGLRTPIGTFHIYRKVSPITLISPWPTSSPYYYSPENAEYAMEFLGGGFFIHDAPWEPASDFGPGSENGVDASHGCIAHAHRHHGLALRVEPDRHHRHRARLSDAAQLAHASVETAVVRCSPA